MDRPERRCEKCHASYAADTRFCPLDGGTIVDLEAAADALVGTTIGGRYLVRRLLGRGGMGAVYAAEHVELGKQVAIKFLLDTDDRDAAARFRREARAACQVTHEHVVQVIDVGSDGRDYLVMEYVEGTDLQRALDDGGPLPPARALDIARQLLLGVDAIHAAGLVHRDLKPSNVLLVARGAGDFVKIMDFGIAKPRAGETVTRTGQAPGTPEYMAPEQLLAGAVDHRADLYAIGLVVFAMLVGELPLAPLARAAGERARSLDDARPGLPRPLVAAVTRALQAAPESRFASARAFLDALDDDASAERMNARTVSAGAKVPASAPAVARRSRAPWLIAGAATLAAIAAIAFALASTRSSEPTPTPSPTPTVVDHLARARDAERAGKLDLAIGEYQEALAADPRAAELLFRIGELSERLGRRGEAATYFERYLAVAPAADDRAAVTARLAALRPPPEAPGDAGVPIDAAPAPKVVARARRRDQICKCELHMSHYTQPFQLCAGKKARPHCQCWQNAGAHGALCRVAPRVEVDGQIVDVSRSGDVFCVDTSRPECDVVGRKPNGCDAWVAVDGGHDGDACAGYSQDSDLRVLGKPVSGQLHCFYCTTRDFEGHDGDPCEGYLEDRFVTGGHFTDCRLEPR